jgi:glucose/arabinose dehydrogenase
MLVQRFKGRNSRWAQLKLVRPLLLLLALLLTACSQVGNSAGVQVQVPSGMDSPPFNQPRQFNVPPGFTISVYARVPNARFMAVTSDDNLLVSQPDKGKISLLKLGADSASAADFLTDLDGPHDLVFATIGGVTYLYIGERSMISRYVYHANNGNDTATDRQVVVKDLPGNGFHPLKSVAIDSQGNLYVMVGSKCNLPHKPNPNAHLKPKKGCSEDNPEGMTRGAIYRYPADKLNQEGKDGQLYAQGLRNAEGMRFLPGTDELWVTINGQDYILYPFHDGKFPFGKLSQKYRENHPPDGFTHVVKGGNYGWPYCDANPDTPNGLVNMPFIPDALTNPDGKVFDCSKATRIDRGIPAHSAPLGLLFLQDTKFPAPYRNAAVIALHGGNGPTGSGYEVAYYPFKNGQPGKETALVSGWARSWGRPVDMAVDQQGNMYISDDKSGTVYKLSSQGE